VFTRVYGDRVVRVNIWQMLSTMHQAPPMDPPPATAIPLRTLVHQAKEYKLGPIVVLPEVSVYTHINTHMLILV
jgi:hypothetical protein